MGRARTRRASPWRSTPKSTCPIQQPLTVMHTTKKKRLPHLVVFLVLTRIFPSSYPLHLSAPRLTEKKKQKRRATLNTMQPSSCFIPFDFSLISIIDICFCKKAKTNMESTHHSLIACLTWFTRKRE